MKLSISNIAWNDESDALMYQFLEKNQIEGLEIAPTRIFPEEPYDKLKEAREYAKQLKEGYNLEVSSMQSIWYGRTENIFVGKVYQEVLLEYTKKAFEFAHAIGCKNLVFGCPKNRRISSKEDIEIAIDFFQRLGEIAINEETILALEGNPPIYNTNFMNTTKEAYEIVKRVGSDGVKLNYDLGTVIYNKEFVSEIIDMMDEVNHVHISEPFLEEIHFRDIHIELLEMLQLNKYNRYVSIEMKNLNDIDKSKKILGYVKSKIGK